MRSVIPPAGGTIPIVRRSSALAATAGVVALSTLAAHQVAYSLAAGSAEAYAATMSATGHDGIWLPLVAIVLFALSLVGFVAARRLLDLSARAARGAGRPAEVPIRVYAGMVAAHWPRFAAATAIIYAVQENTERALAGATPPGLDVLIAHGPGPVLGIVVASLLVAAVAALVRWRSRVLVARIRAALARTRHRQVRRPLLVESRWRARAWVAATASRAPPVARAIP